MKKFLSGILAVLLIISTTAILSGCGPKDKPREAVREFINALRESRWTAAEQVCDKDIFSVDYFSYSKNMARYFLDNQKVKAEIMKDVKLDVATKSDVHGDKATVKVKISNYKLPELLEDYLALVYLNGDSSENPLNMEQIIPKMLEGTTLKRVSTELTINLKKKDGKWIIITDEKLADAITGGLASCGEEDDDEDDSALKEILEEDTTEDKEETEETTKKTTKKSK